MGGSFKNAAPPKAEAEVETATAPNSPWVSPDVPEGFDTVLGYWSDNLPSSFDLLFDPIYESYGDAVWCGVQARLRGLTTHTVTAPPEMIERGILSVEAYPLPLLRERMGA